MSCETTHEDKVFTGLQVDYKQVYKTTEVFLRLDWGNNVNNESEKIISLHFEGKKRLTVYNFSVWFEMLVFSENIFTTSKAWFPNRFASAVMGLLNMLLFCWSNLEEKSTASALMKLCKK